MFYIAFVNEAKSNLAHLQLFLPIIDQWNIFFFKYWTSMSDWSETAAVEQSTITEEKTVNVLMLIVRLNVTNAE